MDPQTVERYFNSTNTVVHLLSNNPRCELRVDPSTQSIQLLVPNDFSEPDVGYFENIKVDYLADVNFYRITLYADGMHYAAYSFIAQIVEELHKGNHLSIAIAQSIDEHRLLLQNRKILSAEMQTGLIGELLLLAYLCSVDPISALSSWIGPQAEQHDFAFGSFDLEVKTTTGENRIHRIGSANQLEASSNRELWFLSIQITAAGSARNGFGLTTLINVIRKYLGPHTTQFNDYLNCLGWWDKDIDSYKARYVLRSVPAFFLVNEQFPALRNSTLSKGICHYEYLSDISYRTDISHLMAQRAPDPLTEFLNYTDAHFGGLNAKL
ncbi:PD-(D/E)XK motif protein [Glutamicibacter ardleyensis]